MTYRHKQQDWGYRSEEKNVPAGRPLKANRAFPLRVPVLADIQIRRARSDTGARKKATAR